MKKRTIGFYVNGPYAGMSVEEACVDLAKIGYGAVELAYAADRMAALRSTAEREGLVLSEAVLQRDYLTRDPAVGRKNVADTLRCLEECGASGVRVVNLFTGPIPWGPDPLTLGKELSVYDAWQRLFEAFDEIVPAAEKNGVALAVENVWGMLCHDFFSLRYLLERYDARFAGVNFDPSHDVISGNMDLRMLVTGWGRERVKHVHLKDAAGVMAPGKFIFPLPGEGLADWNGFRQGLDEIGYEGVMSVEFESNALWTSLDGDLSEAARVSFKALRKLGLAD